MAHEEILPGGVANAGAVRRIGDVVVRPANENSAAIHDLLRHVCATGFDGVPEPISLDPGGEERLRFVPGDTPLPPFPAWSQSDAVLGSTAALLRRFHDATVGFVVPAGAKWSTEMADPDAVLGVGDVAGLDGAPVMCHNDVCPENVVFRGGDAVALLDFDFVAPGTRLYDLARLALMIVPIDDPEDAARTGRIGLDPFTRLRIVADGYGLPPGRAALVESVGRNVATGAAFLQRHIDRGEPAFLAMRDATGGMERYDRRQEWFAANRDHLLDSVG